MPLFEVKPKAKYVPTFIGQLSFHDDELPIAAKIQQRRLQILIHSRLYYKLDMSIIPDRRFEMWCQELLELQTKHPLIAKRICFADAFKNFDGSTGYDLPHDDEWVVRKTNQLLKYHEEQSHEQQEI